MTEILSTKRLVLRPVNNLDLSLLSEWSKTSDYMRLVSSTERKKYHLRFVVCLKKSNKSIGVVYTFSYNEKDGYMFLNVFLKESYRKKGYGAEACVVVICHVFDCQPAVHKIYCDAISTNRQSVSMMRGAHLKQEAFLGGHILHDGVRYDVLRFAIYRENLGFLRGLLQRFKGERVG